MDDLVSMRTITDTLDVSRHTVYRWYKRGLIRRYVSSDGKTRMVRYNRSDVLKLVKQSDEPLPAKDNGAKYDHQ